MNIIDRVTYDVDCMREYFRVLHAFAESSAKSFVPKSGADTQFLPLGIAHLIRPGMACNIYSLVDFWLLDLCAYHHQRGMLSETFDKFKKSKRAANISDLHKYAKYLSEIALIDLSAHQSSFDQLNGLREVRNVLIHAGGHVSDEKRATIECIPAISVQTTLVVVTDLFITHSLDHAHQYLKAVATA